MIGSSRTDCLDFFYSEVLDRTFLLFKSQPKWRVRHSDLRWAGCLAHSCGLVPIQSPCPNTTHYGSQGMSTPSCTLRLWRMPSGRPGAQAAHMKEKKEKRERDIYIYIYTYIHITIYIERDREIDRERERERERRDMKVGLKV